MLPCAVALSYVLLAADVLSGGEHNRAVSVLLMVVTSTSAALMWVSLLRHTTSRLAWGVMATGFSGYAVGFVIVFEFPRWQPAGMFGFNLSDLVSLLLYPCGYVSLVLLVRSRIRRVSAAATLDGAVLGLAGAALALAYVGRNYPQLLSGRIAVAVSTTAYALGGATLLIATLCALPIIGWRVDVTWHMLVVAFSLMTVGDAIFGMQSAAHTFRFGTPLDLLYTAGPVVVSMAAWLRPKRSADLPPVAAPVGFAAPAIATLVAVGILAVDHVQQIPGAGVIAAAAAASLAVGRTALFIGQEKHLARSQQEARTDALTGLGNRRALYLELERCVALDEPQVLALVDLDGFKAVNDTLGHAVGDLLLVEIGRRLGQLPGHVSRLGGDEFAIVIEGSALEGMGLAAAIRSAIAPAMQVTSGSISVTASVGLGLSGRQHEVGTAGELLRRADVALYHAKQLRTGIEPWHAGLDAGARQRLQLVTELRAALANDGEIEAWLQPKVDSRTLAVEGFEALVRWRHPTQGVLSPAEFLSAAEQAGLVPAITRRMLEQALVAVAHLRKSGERVSVAVNVCAADVLDRDFPEQVTKLLALHQLPASALQLEITETVVMNDPERIMATMKELRMRGIGLSLDDYGTGLSSLAHLRSLPVNELKIDRSFVRGLLNDPANGLIVTSTINLAHALGLRVTAEGVEDAATLEALAGAGCDLIQGYYTGHPAPPPAIPAVTQMAGHAQRQAPALTY